MQRYWRHGMVLLALVLAVVGVGVAGAQQGEQGETRPYLGVSIENAEDGVTIREVAVDSPAQEAGLQAGDIVTAVNGDAVADAGDLVAAVGAAGANETITLEITRDGEAQTLEITLGEIAVRTPGDNNGRGGRGGRGNFPPGFENFPNVGGMFGMMNGFLGVNFRQLDDAAAAELEIEQTEGSYITDVNADSPASEAGLQAGDIVTAVNGELTDAERTLRDRLFAYEPGDVVTLAVLRDGETLDIAVTLGEPRGFGGGMFMPFGRDGMPMMPDSEATPEATPEANT